MATAAHEVKPQRPSVAVRWRDKTIISLLESIQRERDLAPAESVLMERTVRRLTPRREVWRWSEKEDRTLILLIRKWPQLRQQKPFQRNNRIRDIAQEFGRSEMAIYRRMERLRKGIKCSNAKCKRKG